MKRFSRRTAPEAARLLQRLPPASKPHLRTLTDRLLATPYLGKALQRELKGYYSVRHSRYRVIYSVDAEQRLVIIHYVGLRDEVYVRFAHVVKKRRT